MSSLATWALVVGLMVAGVAVVAPGPCADTAWALRLWARQTLRSYTPLLRAYYEFRVLVGSVMGRLSLPCGMTMVPDTDGRVWIGSLVDAGNWPALKEHNITHVVSAVHGLAPLYPGRFNTWMVPLHDVPEQALQPHLDMAVAFIEGALNAAPGSRVLVHCVAGRSRSATIIAALQSKRLGKHPTHVLDDLRRVRPIVQPNDGFLAQLETWWEENKP